MNDMTVDQFMDGVCARAEKVQELIPAVLSINELILWTSALLRTSAELVNCADFDTEQVVKIFVDYLDQVEKMKAEGAYIQEKIH